MDDLSAFDDFYRDQLPGVVRALTLAFADRAVAEDAAQVAFEKALRRWRTVRTMDRPGTWVYVVAVRHGQRQIERDRRRPAFDAAPPDPGPEPVVVSEHTVVGLLEQLAPRQRAVVVLRHLAGLPLADIATALGMAEGTVKSTLHASYARLRIDIESGTETGREAQPRTVPRARTRPQTRPADGTGPATETERANGAEGERETRRHRSASPARMDQNPSDADAAVGADGDESARNGERR